MVRSAQEPHADNIAFSEDDFQATSTAFSQAAGVLGGFSMTIFVLVLPPDFLKDHSNPKDWIVGLILLAAFLYVAACLLIANSMNSRVLKARVSQFRVSSLGIKLLHLVNISLAAALTTLVWQFSLIVGQISVGVIAILAVIVGLSNLTTPLKRLGATSMDSALD